MVTEIERAYMWDEYAKDPRARINLGIRRRLAPLMEGDRRRIELMSGLLMSLPGSPIMYYGDEIGMGDNVYLGDRNSVRTPMQWGGGLNAGFSAADPERLWLPVISNALYGYQAINVESQRRNATSLLNWTRRLIEIRRSTQVFGRGSIEFLKPANHRVLAFTRTLGRETVLVVNNLAGTAQVAELDLSALAGAIPIEMFGGSLFPRIGSDPYVMMMKRMIFTGSGCAGCRGYLKTLLGFSGQSCHWWRMTISQELSRASHRRARGARRERPDGSASSAHSAVKGSWCSETASCLARLLSLVAAPASAAGLTPARRG